MSTATMEAPPVDQSPTQGVIAPSRTREIRVVNDNSETGYMMDTAKFEQVYRLARTMGAGSLIPKHLKVDGNHDGTIANCFRVIIQALRWDVDMYALMDESYVVSGKLGYQGKLVAAIIQKHAPLQGRLRQRYSGEGQDRTIVISGRFKGEDEDRDISLSVKQAKTSNDMWVKDPDQKLWYTGVTKWARRHCPDVLLGVLTDDDMEQIEARHATASGPLTLTAVMTPRATETAPCDAGMNDDRRPVAKPDLAKAAAVKTAELKSKTPDPVKPAEPVKPAKATESTSGKREPVSVESIMRRIDGATLALIDGLISDLEYMETNGPLTFDECRQLGEMAAARKKELAVA